MYFNSLFKSNRFWVLGRTFFLKHLEAEYWGLNLLELSNDIVDFFWMMQDIQFNCTNEYFN